MIITTILTVIGCFGFYFFFPDNPKMAYFLTEEEKVHVVRRIEKNRNGVKTKTWKKYQCLEAIFNIKTWLFFFSGITNLIGGIGVQYSILIKSYGFSTAQTTVLNIPSGFAVSISISWKSYNVLTLSQQMIGIIIGVACLRKWPVRPIAVAKEWSC